MRIDGYSARSFYFAYVRFLRNFGTENYSLFRAHTAANFPQELGPS